ncbi:MAG: T9SS type A sorting domain-containing protein [Vicingus serpentipes]|nr:T9SS type A sorting domain-containing protein [Vicingus serpentipes]
MKKTLLFISTIVIGTSSYAQYEGFENWTSNTVQVLDNYETTASDRGVDGANAAFPSTDAFKNTKSIRLETVIASNGDTLFGYFISGDGDNWTPGQQVTIGNVDSIVGYYKYDIQAGDSAVLLCSTFKSGVGTDYGFYITGTQSTWKRFAYYIGETSVDSILLAAATGDPLNNFNGIAGTWIQYDDIQLKNATASAPVVNGDFENWSLVTWDTPDYWETSNQWAFGEPTLPVQKSTDKYAGNYALGLNLLLGSKGDTLWAQATNGYFTNNGAMGGQPFSGSPTSVECYYKFTPGGAGDGASLSIEFRQGGSVVGNYGNYFNSAASTYTPWSQSISAITPDSVLIYIGGGNKIGSQFIIDNLDFVFPVGITEQLKVEKLVSYPNPTTDVLKIKFNLINENNVSIRLVDVVGKELTNRNLGNLAAGEYRESFNTSEFTTGVYFIEFTLGNEKIVNRFVVK